jgi:acyl-CoA thioesterase
MTPTAAAAAKKQQRKVARPKATVPLTPQIKVTGVVPDRPLPSSKETADAGTRIPTMLPVPSSTRAAAVPLSYSSDFSTGADHYFDSHAEYCPVETEQVSRESFLYEIPRPTYYIEALKIVTNHKKKL